MKLSESIKKETDGKLDWWDNELNSWEYIKERNGFDNGDKYDLRQNLLIDEQIQQATKKITYYNNVITIVINHENAIRRLNSIISVTKSCGTEVSSDAVVKVLEELKNQMEV